MTVLPMGRVVEFFDILSFAANFLDIEAILSDLSMLKKL
jgi:hypothetical protein